VYLTHILRGTKKYKIYGHFEGFPLQQQQLFSKRKNQEVCNFPKKNWVDGHQPNFLWRFIYLIHTCIYIYIIYTPNDKDLYAPFKGGMGMIPRGLDPWRIHLHQPMGSPEVIQQVTPLGLTVRLQPPGGGPVSRELNFQRGISSTRETGNVGFWMLGFLGETSYQDPLKRYFLLKWGYSIAMLVYQKIR